VLATQDPLQPPTPAPQRPSDYRRPRFNMSGTPGKSFATPGRRPPPVPRPAASSPSTRGRVRGDGLSFAALFFACTALSLMLVPHFRAAIPWPSRDLAEASEDWGPLPAHLPSPGSRATVHTPHDPPPQGFDVVMDRVARAAMPLTSAAMFPEVRGHW